MSALVLTQRDIEFFKYLHACKVATTKQINRDIYKASRIACHERLKKFHKKDFVLKLPSQWEIDQSYVFSLSSKGMKVIKYNLNNILNGKRFKSYSIAHDLKLVNLKNVLSNFKMVKEYITENQLQTYDLSFFNDDLSIFKEMRADAVACIQDTGKTRIVVPIELEISTKSSTEYQNKISEIYYQSEIKFLFCVCDSKETEKKIKKIERDFIKNQRKKIFYSTYKDIMSHDGEISFTNLDEEVIKLK